MDSILISIKKLLGIGEDYTHFDTDIIIHINSAFSVLTQLGVGPEGGFFISDDSAVWSDYLNDETKLEMVKSYIYVKVKMVFDPPMSSSTMEAMKRYIDEFEWRLNVAVDPGEANNES